MPPAASTTSSPRSTTAAPTRPRPSSPSGSSSRSKPTSSESPPEQSARRRLGCLGGGPQGFEDLLRVPGGDDLLPHPLDGPVGTDEEGGAEDAHELLAVGAL